MNDLSDKLIYLLISILGAGILAALVYVLFGVTTASGQVDYCYVTTSTYAVPSVPNVTMYHLWGHRPWREDRAIAVNLNGVSDVRSAADTYGCHLK